MELPQPRPYGTEGRKPTHDFLSLYSHPSGQQDPRPSQGYLKTHDFLQPLERVEMASSNEENTVKITAVEKPPPPAPLPPPPASVEHILPGGIGTYTINHISYYNQRVVPKPENAVFAVAQASSTERNDDNSNCSSYTGSGFALWEESGGKKGKTGKENVGDQRSVIRDAAVKLGQWTSERPSHSSSNHRSSFNSHSSSQAAAQKNQSFMDMIKSAKGTKEDEEYDEEEEFVIKKEGSFTQKGVLTVKVDEKSTEQKANTPRSKHSATEQRRRSKINDRFQMLRELIPNSDQKRDKASFLLEVIEYIQFLQDKVYKYEGPYQGWNHEPAKLMPWRNNLRHTEGFADQGIISGAGPASLFTTKLDANNTAASPTMHRSSQKQGESPTISASIFKAIDHHPGQVDKVMGHPIPLQPSIFTPAVSSSAAAQLPTSLASDVETTLQPQSQAWRIQPCKTESAIPSDKLKDKELTINSGTINISSAYSQELLNTLTQALQNSGVDLSQASISVQIDLGKRANSKPPMAASIVKDNELPSANQETTHHRVANTSKDSDQALKRLKTGKN